MLSVTSLVDVLFLLIIFFMLTGTFKRTGELELRLPDSSTATGENAAETAQQIELVATDDGTFLLQGAPVERAELPARLVSLRDTDPQAQVVLKAESDVHHGTVVALLDIVRECGFPGVGIGTYVHSPLEEAK